MLFSGNPSMPNVAISSGDCASQGLSFNDYLLGQVRHVVPEAVAFTDSSNGFGFSASNTPEIVQGALVSIRS